MPPINRLQVRLKIHKITSPLAFRTTMKMFLMYLLLLCSIVAALGAAPPPPQEVNTSTLVIDVLKAFKDAITTDPLNSLASWNLTTNPCTWKGLHCRPNTTQIKAITLPGMSLHGSITPLLYRLPHISSLDLSSNNLSGSIPLQLPSTLSFINLTKNAIVGTLQPSTFANLTRLKVLSLDQNSLRGSITPFLIARFPKLTTLILSQNKLSGMLPMEIGQLALLKFLDLSTNLLNGTLPATLGNLTALKSLLLGGNPFHGPIPATLGNCSNLETLDLGSNSISGMIPPALGLGCRNLEYVSFWKSTLSGPIPPEIGLWSRIQFLNLEANRLEGRILDILVNCSQLETLDAINNSFTGSLAPHIGSLFPKLRFFGIMFNSFSGPIPASLGNCSNLDTLVMGFNNLSGGIPKELFRLQKLGSSFDMQFNSLTGSIPPEIGNLTSVVKILLNNNKLTGVVPVELGNLPLLEGVSLEYNNLSGNIPHQLSNCSMLLFLVFNYNRMQGSIPSSFSVLSRLEWLQAAHNMITGPIPSTLSNCTRFTGLVLHHNLLIGQFPSSFATLGMLFNISLAHNLLSGSLFQFPFGALEHLQNLDLSANNFSGSLPISLQNCLELNFLNLSHNFFSGSIPEKWGSLKTLQELDLSFNSLSGKIPITLTDIDGLVYANFSYNQLEGQIPLQGSFHNLTYASFLNNPGLCGMPLLLKPCSIRTNSGLSRKAKIGLIAGTTAILFVIVILGGFLVYRYRWGSKYSDPRIVRWDLDTFNPFVKLGLEEIREATNEFSEENILGSGGTGVVYRGTMKDGKILAFKKLMLGSTALHSFIAELRSAGMIRHRNVVRILGYSSNMDANVIVLEYMPNGNLDSHLHPKEEPFSSKLLSWSIRIRVAMGIAQGLMYLHYDCHVPVVHCDIKPSNVLLDEEMEPRITDFGLAKLIPNNSTSADNTQNLQGSLGYVAPEYASFGQISRKGDVYSYGIVVLEMMTGRRPTDQMFGEAKTLVGWVRSMVASDAVRGVMDERLVGEEEQDHHDDVDERIKFLLKVALACTQENPRVRPTMQEVVQLLRNGLFDGRANQQQEARLTIQELVRLQ